MSALQVKIKISTDCLLTTLISLAVFLISMGIIVAILLTYTPYKTALGIIPFFNMDLESTITSYYSSFILLVSSLVLALITQDKKNIGDKYWRHWLSLSLGFLLLSIDESASVHEFIANLPLYYMNISTRINFSIAIIGFIVTLFLLLSYFKFLIHLPYKTRKRFIISGFIYVSGAFGAELVGGFISLYSENIDAGIYLAGVVLEESLEITGILFFIKNLFLYIEENLLNGLSIFSSLSKEKTKPT